MARHDNDKFDIMEEFRRGVAFDKNNLDDNLMEQPVLFQRISALHANAASDLKDTKQEIELAEAELYIQYKQQDEESRSDEDKKGRGLSESHIKAKIESSKRVQKLRRKESEYNRRVNELAALLESYKQRGHAIREEVKLYDAQYWQTESGGSRRSDAVDRNADRNRREAGRLRRQRQRDDDNDDDN